MDLENMDLDEVEAAAVSELHDVAAAVAISPEDVRQRATRRRSQRPVGIFVATAACLVAVAALFGVWTGTRDSQITATGGADGAPPAGVPEPGRAPTAAEPGLSEAELQDLQGVAETMGLTLEEAIARYGWQEAFSSMLSEAKAAAPESFAGAEIVDGANAWVAFIGEPPAEARAAIHGFVKDNTHVNVEVRTDARVSEADRAGAVEAAHYAVLGHPAVVDATTVVDDRPPRITTTVIVREGADAEVLRQLEGAASEAIVADGLGHVLEHLTVRVIRSTVSTLGGLDPEE